MNVQCKTANAQFSVWPNKYTSFFRPHNISSIVCPLLAVRVKGVSPEANQLQPRRKTDSLRSLTVVWELKRKG